MDIMYLYTYVCVYLLIFIYMYDQYSVKEIFKVRDPTNGNTLYVARRTVSNLKSLWRCFQTCAILGFERLFGPFFLISQGYLYSLTQVYFLFFCQIWVSVVGFFMG